MSINGLRAFLIASGVLLCASRAETKEPPKTKEPVIFEGKMPDEARKAAVAIAEAIRGANEAALVKYQGKQQTSADILTFWKGYTRKLAELRFRASFDKQSGTLSLSDAEHGISSCSFKKEAAGFVASNCMANDGN